MLSPIGQQFEQDQSRAVENIMAQEILSLVQVGKEVDGKLVGSQYVGEVYSISYETALVQIHDFHRQALRR